MHQIVLKSLEYEEFKTVLQFDAFLTEILLVKDLECAVSDCANCTECLKLNFSCFRNLSSCLDKDNSRLQFMFDLMSEHLCNIYFT